MKKEHMEAKVQTVLLPPLHVAVGFPTISGQQKEDEMLAARLANFVPLQLMPPNINPAVVVNAIESSDQAIEAETAFSTIVDLVRAQQRDVLHQYLRTLDLSVERQLFYNELKRQLNEAIEQLPESLAYEGDVHYNANTIDAWLERFRIVTRYLADKIENQAKPVSQQRFFPGIPALEDSPDTWNELKELESKIHELEQELQTKAANIEYEMKMFNRPVELSDAELTHLVTRIGEMKQELESRPDLTSILNNATQVASADAIITERHPPHMGSQQAAAASSQKTLERLQLQKRPLSELLHMTRGAILSESHIENALQHLWNLTSQKEDQDIRLEQELEVGHPGEIPTNINGEERQLYMDSLLYIVDTFDNNAQSSQWRAMNELLHEFHEKAIGVSLELLDHSLSLHCQVCGFQRFVDAKYAFLYEPVNQPQAKLFRCSDGTTILNIQCGDADDATSLANHTNGFVKQALVYEDEALAREQDILHERQFQQAERLLDINADLETKEEAKAARLEAKTMPREEPEHKNSRIRGRSNLPTFQPEIEPWYQAIQAAFQAIHVLEQARGALLNLYFETGNVGANVTKQARQQQDLRKQQLLRQLRDAWSGSKPSLDQLNSLDATSLDQLIQQQLERLQNEIKILQETEAVPYIQEVLYAYDTDSDKHFPTHAEAWFNILSALYRVYEPQAETDILFSRPEAIGEELWNFSFKGASNSQR